MVGAMNPDVRTRFCWVQYSQSWTSLFWTSKVFEKNNNKCAMDLKTLTCEKEFDKPSDHSN
jgi:hypothetical protein